MSHSYVLDSFAVLCFLYGEDGAGDIEEILRQADAKGTELHMSVINLGEVFYSLIRRQGNDKAQQAISLLNSYPVQIIDADRSLTLEASLIKAAYPIAYADCFAAALAKRLQAVVITGDPEFRQVEDDIEIYWISGRKTK